MTPIAKAINEVRHSIPPQVLDLVFSQSQFKYVNSLATHARDSSIEMAIREKIIEARVRYDCDINGGAQVDLPITNSNIKPVDDHNYIVNLSNEATEGRYVSSVLALIYANSGMMGNGTYPGLGNTSSGVVGAASDLMNASRPASVHQTARVSVVGHNTILVENHTGLVGECYLRCIVSNDSEFTNIKPRSINHFAKLVVLATKAYIYNVFIVELGRGQIYNGQELGIIKDIIDSYADANELYNEYLATTWRKVALMNDDARWGRMLRLKTGGLL